MTAALGMDRFQIRRRQIMNEFDARGEQPAHRAPSGADHIPTTIDEEWLRIKVSPGY
jgi:hypothetical protein